MLDSPASGLDTAEPELCRVSVIGGNTQVDVGLPATVPIAAFIGNVVDLIESRNPDLTEHDDGGNLRSRHWSLARIGKDAIPPNQTLTDADVFDGELLVLRSVTAKESPALFDDVIDAVSRLTVSSFHNWSPTAARWMAYTVGIAATVGAAILFLLSRAAGAGVVPACIAAGVAVGALVAATLSSRAYQAAQTATVLSLAAMVLVATSAALFVPNQLGWPHLLLACTATFVVAVAAYRITGVGATLYSAAMAIAFFGGIAAAVVLVWDPAVPRIGAGLVAAGVLCLSMVPRLAVGFARLPVPPVPTAGAAIDPTDHEPRPTIEGIGAIGATAIPSAAKLEQRAKAANQYQSGVLIGIALAIGIGAVLAADLFGSPPWHQPTLCVVAAWIMCLRGRSFADLTQASTLIGGGALTLAVFLAGYGFGDDANLVVAGTLVLVFAAASAFFGIIGPTLDVSPVTRRINEIFEYGLIVLIVPLMFWVLNLYSFMRNL